MAQPPKKANQSGRPATKPQPKAEQSMPRAKNGEAAPAARTMSKTAAPKQRATPNPQNDLPSETAISASTIVQPPASDEPPKEANQAVVAAAGAAWLSLPTVDSTPVTTAATVEATQPATDHANAVQISNGSVLTGNWSMFSYLFLILSGVLAVMAASGSFLGCASAPSRRSQIKRNFRPLTRPVRTRCTRHRCFRNGIKTTPSRLFRSVRRHSSEIVFGVLVVVFRGDCVATLGFSSGERQIPLIVSLRIGRARRCGPGT